jgi:peptidoglycan hydrolase-like protein with peptidoglycan-binding domain
MIQHLLARGCGDYGPYNQDNVGGGMNQGCVENWTNCDGKFGKETKQAVEEFQEDNGQLDVDGKVGVKTLAALCV